MGIETHRISVQTVDGLHLDGDLAAVDGARAAAVLCHPHPLYGGNRHDGVVSALFSALPAAGITALRFDFRGVGESEGEHGGGSEEQLDLAGAVDLLSLATDAPLWAVGYSFGGLVVLATMHTAIEGKVAIAPPIAMLPHAPPAASDHRPLHVIVPRHDQYSDPDSVAPIIATWRNTSMSVVESADHFLAGHQQAVADLVVQAIA